MNKTENNKTHCSQDDFFLSPAEMQAIAAQYGTPLFLFDEAGIRRRAQHILSLFPIPGSRQYFPMHKCPHPALLSILQEEGLGIQCRDKEELATAREVGFTPDSILFSTMVWDENTAPELCRDHIPLLAGCPLALNGVVPGQVYLLTNLPRKRSSLGIGKVINTALGYSREKLPAVIQSLRRRGVSKVGLWIRYEGNVTDIEFLSQWVSSARTLAEGLAESGVQVDHIHMEGGLGILYNRVKLQTLDTDKAAVSVAQAMEGAGQSISFALGEHLMEPCAVFAARVLAASCTDGMVVVDASQHMLRFNTVDRYHHISVLGKEWVEGRSVYQVLGSVSANSNWLGRRRVLQSPMEDDILILHDVGCSVASFRDSKVLLRKASGEITKL